MQIGTGPRRVSEGVVDSLLECHERIRRFAKLAEELGAARAAPPEQIADAAAKVARYFGEALPLHAADEDESIAPRLRGRDHDVDEALDTMHREHAAHAEPLAALLEHCGALQRAPRCIDELAPAVSRLASELTAAFQEHLEREERVVFPAIAKHLTPQAQADVLAEMRARRAPR